MRRFLVKLVPPFVKQLVQGLRLKRLIITKVKPYLSKGIYTLRGSRIKEGLGFIMFRVSENPSKYCLDVNDISVYIAKSKQKAVVLSSNYVISIYSNSNKYKLDNYRDFYNLLPYPKAKVFDINYKDNIVISERVKGQSNFDGKSVAKLCGELLQIGTLSKTCEKPSRFNIPELSKLVSIKYHVQHGDMGLINIIWENSETYKVVDFDTVGVYPSLFDFLTVLILVSSKRLISYYEGKFDNEITKYMNAHNIHAQITDFKDECLAAVLLITPKIREFHFRVRKDIPANYVKAREALALLS